MCQTQIVPHYSVQVPLLHWTSDPYKEGGDMLAQSEENGVGGGMGS